MNMGQWGRYTILLASSKIHGVSKFRDMGCWHWSGIIKYNQGDKVGTRGISWERGGLGQGCGWDKGVSIGNMGDWLVMVLGRGGQVGNMGYQLGHGGSLTRAGEISISSSGWRGCPTWDLNPSFEEGRSSAIRGLALLKGGVWGRVG